MPNASDDAKFIAGSFAESVQKLADNRTEEEDKKEKKALKRRKLLTRMAQSDKHSRQEEAQKMLDQLDEAEAAQKLAQKNLQSLAGISKKEAVKRQGMVNHIADSKVALAEMEKALEASGEVATDNKKFNKESAKIKQQELNLRKATATSPAAKKEIEEEQKKLDEEQRGLLGKIAGGMDGLVEQGKNALKKAGKSAVDMLKGAAIGAALMAVLAFFESEYWVKTKKWLTESLVPALKNLWVNFLQPIAKIFAGAWMKTWENIKVLITGLQESFALFGEGKWWEGIKKFFSSIGGFLGKTLDIAITALYNTIGSIFGFKKVDSIGGAIGGFFTDLYDDVIFWVKLTWFNITSSIADVWKGIKDWFAKIWSWGKSDGEDWSLKTFVNNLWKKVKKWFTDMWSWGKKDGEGPFKLSTFVDTAFAKAWGWVKSLFIWGTEPVSPKDSWIKKTVNAAITAVQKWATSLFTWAETPGGSWISKIVKDAIIKVKAWALSLFTWFKKHGEIEKGKPWSLSAIVDAAVLKVKDWALSLFSWATGPVKPEDSWIRVTVHDAIAAVKKWATSLFRWANTDEATDPAGFSISGVVKGAIRSIVTWATGLFSWVSKAGHVKDKDGKDQPWSFMKMLGAVVEKIIGWATGLFSWAAKAGTVIDKDGKERPWSLIKFIGTVVDKIVGWVTGIFEFGGGLAEKLKAMLPRWMTDPIGAVKDMITSLTSYLPSWLGGSKSKEDVEKEAKKIESRATAKTKQTDSVAEEETSEDQKAIQKAILAKKLAKEEKLLRQRQTLFEKSVKQRLGGKVSAEGVRSGYGSKGLLKSEKIVAELKEQQKKLNEAALKKGSIFTHDQGLYDRLDRIFPSAENGARTEMMKQFKLDGAGAAGGMSVISAPVVTNAPSTSTVNLTTTDIIDRKVVGF